MSCDSLRVLRHLPAGRTGIVRRRRLGASRKGGEGRLHENGLKISEFVKLFSLEVLNRGSDYEEALLTITDVNRPGLQFHDFYDYFDPRRIQVIGKAEVMEELMARRRASQPLEYPSAGSTFKRPEGYFAGTLIDQCGLKGLTVGGAQVSEKHAGFVINRGGATTADILALIARVQETVYKEKGVRLEPEVRIVR